MQNTIQEHGLITRTGDENNKMPDVLLINGPNLNMLGVREPGIYGSDSLAQIETGLVETAASLNLQLVCFQSNAEHKIVGRIHQAYVDKTDFILINPAAFTHTSVAIRDALLATAIPFIEIHLSNVHARESFRKHSYFSDIARGIISGFGRFGYEMALQAACQYVRETSRP